jgi:hypothetical protein
MEQILILGLLKSHLLQVYLKVGIHGYGYFNIILELFNSLIHQLLIFMPKKAMHFAKVNPISWFDCTSFKFWK